MSQTNNSPDKPAHTLTQTRSRESYNQAIQSLGKKHDCDSFGCHLWQLSTSGDEHNDHRDR
jgi:hypothetical protein